MIENEFKVMLTEKQYKIIHGSFAWNKQVSQVNYYFDTKEFSLINSHVTCRVRFVEGEYLLQMKLPNGAEYSRIEVEEKLGDTLPIGFTGEKLSALCGRENMPDVWLIGELKTYRSVKKFEGAEIDLDKSEYFGKTDYELEIEFTDEAEARALLGEIILKAEIAEKSEVCLGKVHRFLAEYKKRWCSDGSVERE